MTAATSSQPSWKRILLRHEAVLLVVLAIEIGFFQSAGRNFGTAENISNIVRHSAEIGLLALVMMPVILTAGIDLSVGSTMGLSAMIFGRLVHDAGLSAGAAGACALLAGAAAGGLNAALITLLRLPPLIVTLGTYSLYRGIAVALTSKTAALANFSSGFAQLGHGSFAGVPIQAWIFVAVAVAVWLQVHRTTAGRGFRAIGFSPEGARYAGIPVTRRVATVYVQAGIVAALAGLIFTARVGEAKADAGTGLELAAITAVVLGGTSIFGGVGSVHGTLLGVAAIAVLMNGPQRILAVAKAGIANELSGLLTGLLLLVALAVGALAARWQRRGS